MISQCVTFGTEVKLSCPIDDHDAISWFSEDILLDYEYADANFTAIMSTNSDVRGYETYEISCRRKDSQQFYFFVVIVTGNINCPRV